jgi:hypothetical protein
MAVAVVVMSLPRFRHVRPVPIEIAQSLLGFLVETALVRDIVTRPVSLVFSPVVSR